MESSRSAAGHLRQKHHVSRGSSQGSRGSHREHGGMLWSVKSVKNPIWELFTEGSQGLEVSDFFKNNRAREEWFLTIET